MKTMIISIIAVLASVAVSGQSLTLTVKDVEHVEGTLYVAIYSSKENFMKKPLFGFRVAVKDRTRQYLVKEFLPGPMPSPSFRMKTEMES